MSTRTNIVLDDELVSQAMLKARVTTKKAAVEAALRAYVRKPDYSALLALRGQGLIDDDYDPRGRFGLTDVALARRGLGDPKATPSVQTAVDRHGSQAIRAGTEPANQTSRRVAASKRRNRDAA